MFSMFLNKKPNNNLIKSIVKKFSVVLSFLLLFNICACSNVSKNYNFSQSQSNIENEYNNNNQVENQTRNNQDSPILEDGTYSDKENVALYLITYHKLPKNYITKKEAKKLGWVSSDGNLWEVAYGLSIGGDIFTNREKRLPKVSGRTYYECDIDFDGTYRNAKRIIYASDFDESIGCIYYTEDHYNTFEKLY